MDEGIKNFKLVFKKLLGIKTNNENKIILSGNLVQDHEFIHPFYRLLEEGFSVDVCLNEGKPVKGILGTDILQIKIIL